MGDTQSIDIDKIMKTLPSGLLRIALDDELTIIYASDTFYKLIDADISKPAKLPKTIVKTVYSTDIINYTHQMVAQKKRKDNQFLLFYRVLLKNGDLRWIMINGSKTDEIYKKNNKDVPVYFSMALDITDHMAEYKKLEQKVDYHSTISELSKELFFEYVIASDTLSFSPLFREVFGKESNITNFSYKLERTSIIYPADISGVIKTYRSVMSGKKQVRSEFRMITKDGDTAWYVCYASIIFDENKNPYKVVGKLSAIYKRKEEAEETPKIQLDNLTKLYNKDTAERMMLDTMLNQDVESLSAILMCEVRNYKNINDIVRIIDGENILSTVANILKSSFRSTDIIGRMGLSEFAVYMRDINSDKSVYKRAEEICREVNDLYSYNYNKNQISISIGITFVKGSMDYASAMANAKTALVMAKKENSSSFDAFNPSINK